MKAERPPHHTPLMGEDTAVTNGEDLTACMRKLTLDSKDKYIIPKTKEEEDKSLKNVIKKKDIKVEAKDDEKKGKEVDEKPSPKKDDAKEKEKPKVKEEPLGVLCARGPDARCKLTSQSRVSTSPYVPHPQKNATLTNGGHFIYNPQQTQLSSEIHYPHPLINQPSELSQEYYTDHHPSVPLDNSNFINNFTEYPLEVTECPEFQQHALSPAKPEPHCDPDGAVREIIKEVISDPVKRHNVCKDLQECLQKTDLDEVQNIPETQIDQSPYGSYRSLSPESSPQVVPRLSPYSTSYGSPPGPSSPNQYANTPSFSPNIPSPRGYMSDDSSTHMYPYTSPPMMNNSYLQSDPINLDAICGEPPEDKRLEVRELVQELNNTCSQACSKTESGNLPLNVPISNVHLTTNPIVIATVIAAPSPPIRAPSNHGTKCLRKILPKPSEDAKQQNQGEQFQVQTAPPRQQANNNRVVQNQREHILPARDELRDRCSLEKVNKLYMRVKDYSDEQIAAADKDGDTGLMILICDKDLPSKLEQLYTLVERCKKLPKVLSARNNDEQSALYMACMVKYHDPLLAKYLAEAMIDVKLDMNEVNKMGSTLIHLICKEGDKCAEVLDQLLSLLNHEGRQCFDINKSDYEGMTPLHVAVSTHSELPSLQIINVLLKHGADMLKKDGKQGSNPLHFAVATDKPDLNLIKILCDPRKNTKEAINAINYQGDTPLHVAMACGGSIDLHSQCAILECLRASGASRAIRNHNGKAPLELAPEPRKLGTLRCL